VVAVAQFKLLPMAFLLLLPMVAGRRGWPLLGKALAIGVATWSVNLCFEGSFRAYLDVVSLQDERGTFAPSSLAFARDVAEHFAFPMWSGTLGYLLFAAAVATALWFGIGCLRRREGSGDRVVALGTACVAYALIAPRMKDYSYALLIVPALVAIEREWRARRFSVDLLLVFVPGTAFTRMFGDISASWISAYWPLLCALVLARVYGLALMTPRWVPVRSARGAGAIESPAVT
jgi:hypothetical protein